MTKVVRYETEVSVAGQHVPLRPDTRAEVTAVGSKQSVQGWVIKTDQQNTEVTFHVRSGSQHLTAHYRLKNSLLTLREFHAMAAVINSAAGEANERHRQRAQRLPVAIEEALQEISHRSSLHAARNEVLAAQDAGQRVCFESEKERQKLKSRWERCADDLLLLEQAAAELVAMQTHLRRRLDEAHETTSHQAAEADPALPVHPVVVQANATMPTPPQDSPVALLEHLGRLREQGILSDEEFNAKKREILARM